MFRAVISDVSVTGLVIPPPPKGGEPQIEMGEVILTIKHIKRKFAPASWSGIS